MVEHGSAQQRNRGEVRNFAEWLRDYLLAPASLPIKTPGVAGFSTSAPSRFRKELLLSTAVEQAARDPRLGNKPIPSGTIFILPKSRRRVRAEVQVHGVPLSCLQPEQQAGSGVAARFLRLRYEFT